VEQVTMAKPNITTRATKGSALSWTEGDANLENLRDATITINANGTDVVSELNGTVTLVAGTNVTLTGDNTAKTVTINAAGGIADVVSDTSPQLGGNLDVNGNKIVSTSAANIEIEPDSTGYVHLNTNRVRIGDAGSPSLITTPDVQTMTLSLNGGSGSPELQVRADGGIALYSYSTGNITLDGQKWPKSDGTTGQVLSTDGSGNLSWSTVSGGSSTLGGLSDVTVTSPTDGQALTYNTSTGEWVNSTVGGGTPTQVTYQTTPSSTDLYFTMTDSAGSGDKSLYAVNAGGLKWNSGTGQLSTAVNFNMEGGNLLMKYQSGIWLYDADNTNRAVITVPTNIPANYVLTLPTSAGSSGQVLSTDGSGNLSWASSGSFDPASPGAIGGTTPSTGAFTTVSATTTETNGAINVTYNPVSASGAAIQATGKDSQGGTGYFDFLKVTNTTSGATNSNKTFRLNSTGTIEIINSGYSGTLATLSNSGDFISTSLTSASFISFKEPRETVYAIGNSGATTLTPNAANGSVQTITATGNFTLSAFSSPVSGQTITFIITQDGTGSRTLTSTMKFAGGTKTLSTAASSIDILTVSYIGTTYYASLAKGFA